MTTKLLMIALDGADSERLERWSDDGRLPHLAALRRRGATRRLVGPLGASDDSLWASFQYGVDEATHGRVYHYFIRPSGKYALAVDNEADRDAFWRRLSAQGRRVGVLDVPKTPAPREINGFHLADWLVHGRYAPSARSYPATLAQEVLDRFGPPPPSACGYYQAAPSDEQVRSLVANLATSTAMKRDAALHYLAAEPWDLFIVGFKEGHCAGHGLWNFEDPSHPEFDAARSARLDWPLQQVFQAIDGAVGDLAAAAGPEAEVVVFSTTRMEPIGSSSHLEPQIVSRLNAVLQGGQAHPLERALERLTTELPQRTAHRTRRVLRWLGLIDRWPAVVKAGLASDNSLSLRLVGGGPADAADRAALLQTVAGLLGELVDIESGLPVVAAITYPSSEGDGPCAAALSDMLAHYRGGVVPRAITSPRLGEIRGRRRRRRPGNHAPGGLAVFAGPRSPTLGNEVHRLEDFAPFIDRALAAAG